MSFDCDYVRTSRSANINFFCILAIETTLGENILNTGYTIERPGSYNRLNTIVKYHRIGMLEKIHIAGPISKDIKVMVMQLLNYCI